MGIFTRKDKSREPQHVTSLTAGGASYRVSDYTDFTKISLLKQKWQQDVFNIYDAEGHLYYATNYIGGAMARIQLVGAIKPKNHGKLEKPRILESGPVADAIANIESPSGGQSGFLRQIARNIFLTGESWVIASAVTYPDGKVVTNWDAVSVDELVAESGRHMRRSLPGAQPEPLPDGAVTFRIWKEHPRYSQLADSGTRSCIELLEKIIILNRAEKAVARSQLAGSGILALPQELVPPAWQNQMQTPNPMESNPLWQALAESMLAPLQDEAAPSAVVPLLLVGPGEIIKNIKYEPLDRKFDSGAAQASIKMAIEQVANTLELPKEILLGVGEATHWTAWAIREDVFQAHIQPLIELVCAGLTRTFLRQALSKFTDAELKSAGIDNRDEVIVWYDPSELVIQPDKGDKMLGLHDRFVITDAALAEETGVPKDQLLDPESLEYKRRVGVKLADPNMAVSGETPPPADELMEKQAALAKDTALSVQAAKPAPVPGGGARPKGVSPARGTSPQGPRAAPPKLASQRRARRGLPQDSRSLSASAHTESGAELGQFDLNVLRRLHLMAERHIQESLRAVTASADPSDFIDPSYLDDFVEMGTGVWADATGLITQIFGELETPMFSSTVTRAVERAGQTYLDMLKGVVNDKAYGRREPIFGEFQKGNVIQYGDVRPILVNLGGGTTDVTVPLMGGVASGNTMREWLRSNGIDTKEKIWLYGYEDEPRRTFNGHLQMDGLVFTDWDEEGLVIAPQDAWLRRSHYQPGDHWGCACVVAPYIPNFGAEYKLETV